MKHTPVTSWRQQKKDTSLIGTRGKILQWTLIRVPSSAFQDQSPYPVVIVECENGKRTIGQLVDWQKEDLQKNREVVTVLRRIYTNDSQNIIHYILKFKPL